MEDLLACNYQDSSDEADDADEKNKTATPDRYSAMAFYGSDSDDSSISDFFADPDGGDLLQTKRKELMSAVKDVKKDIVKTLLDEFFNTSSICVESKRLDSHPNYEELIFEIWEDAMYIAMEIDTEHSEEIMKLLLDCDIIWGLEIKMDDFILHRLIRDKKEVNNKNLRLIEILLKSGKINVNATDEYGKTALHYAEQETFISLLIYYGADVNKKDEKEMTPFLDMWGKRVSVLQTILKEAGTLMDLDAVDYNGRTALMIAARNTRPGVVDMLLKAGASVNLADHLGLTALHHALHRGFDLLDYDHFPRNSEELKKRKEIFTILCDAKDEQIDCYGRDKEWIVQKIEIVEMLLQRPDVDVNALSFEKFSPLDIAEASIPETPSSIKDALKEKGAVLNVFRQTETQSPSSFHLDVRCRLFLQRLFRIEYGLLPDGKFLSLEIFEKRLLSLIEVFQDEIVSGKDQKGRTALHLVAICFSIIWTVHNSGFRARSRKHCLRDLANKLVKELIRIGCSVNETDIYGRTPLHYANLNLSNEADASIKGKDGNTVIDEIPQKSSTKPSDIVKAVTSRNDEKYFLRLINNTQMEIEFRCSDSKVGASDDRELRETWLKTVPRIVWEKGEDTEQHLTHSDRSSYDSNTDTDIESNYIYGASTYRVEQVNLKTVPRLLWEEYEYAFRHPLVEQITKEVKDLMDAVAKEIERLDPRFEIRVEFVGSSNEGTKIDKPNEFDFCFVLTKISELCEVSRSPELPTGFVRLKRKPAKVEETNDFDSFFDKHEILNTEKLNWQFATILSNAMVNIESQHSFDWNFELSGRDFANAMKKASNIKMIKPLNFTSIDNISIDVVPCIHFDNWWPDEAKSNVSDEIKKSGCNLVCDRPQDLYPWVPYSERCARISFSKAESDMIKQSCDNARQAYMMGKTMIEKSESDSKYALKNSLLYCIEALTPSSGKASQLGLSLEEMEFKFHQMDRYLWLKCLMKCHLEFVLQDFCPCYFLPNSSPFEKLDRKRHSWDWMKDENRTSNVPWLYRIAYALYRCTSNDTSKSCYQSPAPDPLLRRFDRNQLIASLCEIAYE